MAGPAELTPLTDLRPVRGQPPEHLAPRGLTNLAAREPPATPRIARQAVEMEMLSSSTHEDAICVIILGCIPMTALEELDNSACYIPVYVYACWTVRLSEALVLFGGNPSLASSQLESYLWHCDYKCVTTAEISTTAGGGVDHGLS
ncbi:hypothetical protein CBL_00236 [Carabus blaptoides fortunei]